MAKIPPRSEILNHPLYQATMTAQQLAYLLMRECPPEMKADATWLYKSCVQATTYAQYALDPEEVDALESFQGIAAAAADAQSRLVPLAGFSNEGEPLGKKLAEIQASAEEAVRGPEVPAA